MASLLNMYCKTNRLLRLILPDPFSNPQQKMGKGSQAMQDQMLILVSG